MSGRVWLINPDAEQEMQHSALRPGTLYQAPASLGKTFNDIQGKFQALTQSDVTIWVGGGHKPAKLDHPPSMLSCWCPTPGLCHFAQQTWGITLRAPHMAVLARCNDKLEVSRFNACLEERAKIVSVAELESLIADRGWTSRDERGQSVGEGGLASVRLKRRFGQAGRGQRRVNEFLSADDQRFVQDSAKWGGLIAEPELSVANNWSIHGVITEDSLVTGDLCSFRTDRFSSPSSSVVRDDHSPAQAQKIRHLAGDVAATMQQWGYFGPFGLDFVSTLEGRLALVDINARFTLGFTAGMAHRRSLALDLIDRCTLPR